MRKTLDLTGDRPLTLREARKLARWWNQNSLYDCTLTRVRRNRFHVTATWSTV